MSFSRFLVGLAMMLAVPLLCFGIPLGITAFANGQPQAGDVTCSIDRLWAFPGQTAVMSISRAPVEKMAVAPPPPLDIVLIVDQSSSMKPFESLLPDAVRRATSALARPDSANRFALVYFSNTYNLFDGWTHDRSLIVDNAKSALAGGGTDSDQVIAAIDQLASDSPASVGRRQIVILFSDMQFPSPEAVVAGAERLKRAGTQFYVLLTPGEIVRELAETIAGSAQDPNKDDYIILMDDESQLSGRLERMFALFLSNASRTVQSNAWVHPETFELDSEHALAQDWRLQGASLLTADSILSDAGVAFALPLVPRKVGLWQVGERPPEVTVLDRAGRAVAEPCSRRPMILVAAPWLVLLPFLPAILWLLNSTRFWLRKPVQIPLPPPAFPAVEHVVRAVPLPVCSHSRQLVGCQMPNFFSRIAGLSPRV